MRSSLPPIPGPPAAVTAKPGVFCRTMPRVMRLLPMLVLTFATACADPRPHDLDAAGTYDLVTAISLPSDFPATAGAHAFLTRLQLLGDDPAAALFGALDEAGISVSDELVQASPQRDELKSAINAYVKGQPRGGGVIAQISALTDQANRMLMGFDLQSTLTLPPTVNQTFPWGTSFPSTQASHSVDGVLFPLAAADPLVVTRRMLEVAGIPVPHLDAEGSVAMLASPPGDASLILGGHVFGLPYGQIVLMALDRVFNGTLPLRNRLGRAFDCDAMALALPTHEREVTQICQTGLDLTAAKLEADLTGLTIEALTFLSGKVALWDRAVDEAPDKRIDRLDQGTWKATIDTGAGPQPCTAVFGGTRH